MDAPNLFGGIFAVICGITIVLLRTRIYKWMYREYEDNYGKAGDWGKHNLSPGWFGFVGVFAIGMGVFAFVNGF